MNALEQASLDFIRYFQKRLIEDRALETVLQMLDPEILWIGPNSQVLFTGVEEAKRYFLSEAAACAPAYTLRRAEYRCHPLSDGWYSVWGRGCLFRKDKGESHAPIELCISTICHETEAGFRLRQISFHVSAVHPEHGKTMPNSDSGESNFSLKRQLAEQTEVLLEKNQNLDALTNNIPGGVMCCDNTPGHRLLQYSDGFLNLFGYTAEEIKKQFENQFSRLIDPRDRNAVERSIQEQLQWGDTKEAEYRVCCKDGRVIWVLDRGQRVPRKNGVDDVFYCILIDITERKKMRESLHLSLERYQIIMNQTQDIIFEWDLKENSLVVSQNWEKKFGYILETGKLYTQLPLCSHVLSEDRGKVIDMLKSVQAGTPYLEEEVRIQKQDGDYLWCRLRVTLQAGCQGRPSKAVGAIIDIDHEKRETQSLKTKAERDTLTGLYNKGTVQSLIEHHLESMLFPHPCALFVIDLDNFKQINDWYGHLSGDILLSDIAGILKHQFRSNDILGRIGGDEFCVFMREVDDTQIVVRKAKAILEEVRRVMEQEENVVSCSIGIAMSPADGTDFLTLFHHADLALYHSKTQGKNQFSFYAPCCEFMRVSQPEKKSVQGQAEGKPPVFHGELAEYIFRVLYQAVDIEKVIPSLLEILGEQFQVSRVYIYEMSSDGKTAKNTFEWCNSGVSSEIDHLQSVPAIQFSPLIQSLQKTGVFYCKDVTLLHNPEARNLLSSQGIQSVLQCAIRENGQFRGAVGFDECKSRRIWTQEQIDVLSFIAQIVSVFLLKKREQKRTSQLMCNIQEILDQVETPVLVSEKETGNVLYFNRCAQALFPSIQAGESLCEILHDTPNPWVRNSYTRGKKDTSENPKPTEENERRKLRKKLSILWAGERPADVFFYYDHRE